MSEKGTLNTGRRTFLKATGAAAGAAALTGTAVATPGREPGPKEDEILVGVAKTVDDLEGSVAQHVPGNAEVVHSNDRIGYVAVKFPSHASENARQNFIDAITKQDHVRYAEPNVTYEALYTPNDPQFSQQYAPQQVNAPDAWDTTLGDSNVVLSIIDQGMEYDHDNLEENMDGSVPDYGENFAGAGSDPYPVNQSENHGTHVGGIAGGATDNGTGHAGISNCSMLSARALDESGGGSLADIADAITWSADQGVDIINMSLGGPSADTTMENAVNYAHNEGVLLVAAAGNDFGGPVGYPAAYDNVVAVSALDPDESLANYSSTGPEVDLAAPGTDVLSADNGNSYTEMSGTSMASPVVAGVAGLVLSTENLSNNDLRARLKNTAVDLGLPSDQQGEGRVDAANAISDDPGDPGDDDPGDDDGDDDDDDPGDPGDGEEVTTVTDSLGGSWDSDCWSYSWHFSNPSQVVIDLDGPDAGAVFDLYANEGRAFCPTTTDWDYRSYNWGADEQIVIDNPSTATDLFLLVDAWDGSGSYTLTVTEKN